MTIDILTRLKDSLHWLQRDGFITSHQNAKDAVVEITTLREQVEKLTKERDALVDAIDSEMVVTHMGVFNVSDDPKIALNKICCYAQDLGKFFAEGDCKEQLAALAEQNEKLRAALDIAHAHADSLADSPEEMRFVNAVRLLPDLASPVLNRIRAEGMKLAAEIATKKDFAIDSVIAIRARAAELEKTNG